MTQKQKAIKLCEKFHEDIKYGVDHSRVSLNMAKYCATTCVEEILSALNDPPIKNEHSILWRAQNEYWQGVKSEIKKL